MKHVTLLVSLLFFVLTQFSCDSNSDIDITKEVEPENHIEVGEKYYNQLGLMARYSKVKEDDNNGMYPLTLYLYQNDIVYTNEIGLIEDAFVNIRMKLLVPQNGTLAEGTYTDAPESHNKLNLHATAYTNVEGARAISRNNGKSGSYYFIYGNAELINTTLSVTHSEDGQYILDFKAKELNGNDVNAYYKGTINKTMIHGR